jgi:hypothetical protein
MYKPKKLVVSLRGPRRVPSTQNICTIARRRQQQQGDAAVDRHCSVTVFGITLREGIYGDGQQKYYEELFHCSWILRIKQREILKKDAEKNQSVGINWIIKEGKQRTGSAVLRFLLYLRSDSFIPPPGGAFLWFVCFDQTI